jgi:DNA-binding transcriptional ArsR family regulator
MTGLAHPDIDEIVLSDVLAALGDETRLAIVATLARNEHLAMTCSQFLEFGSKTALSYHFAKLREAGLISVRPEGTRRLISLRHADLEQRFPGLLDSLIACHAVSLTGAEP